MKKLLTLLAILLMAMTAWADAITAEAPTEGNGQSGSPYKIASAANLVWFAQQVNGGQTNINAKLTADIDLGTDQTMIGTDTHKYAGTFDGDGHTVTVNYTATAQYTALFSVVGDATIKNLKTAGSISTGYQYAAGIVAIVRRTANISDCASSIAITSTFTETKDGTHGGIVAYCGTNDSEATATVNLTNVLFNGKLLGGYAKNCGGLIGWTKTSATITNCLFNPSEVTVSTTNAQTLARGNNVTITNSFYSKTLGGTENQGTSVTANALSTGEVCYELNGQTSTGTLHWYQNIDHNTSSKDAAPVLDNTHSTVYKNLINKYTNHTERSSYDADGEMYCSACNRFMYHQEPNIVSDVYQIANKGNLCWFANKVNGGSTSINGKLTADVSLGSNNNMIGTSTNMYAGTFDGDGHTITINYTATAKNTALFCYVNGATIQNLKTAGNISTGYMRAAGIVAYSKGSTQITKCISSVAITSDFTGSQHYAEHGGIVAYNYQGNLSLTNVLFDGKLLGNVNSCGGLIGQSNGSSTITNCLFNPSEVTIDTYNSSTMDRGNVTVNNSYYVTALGAAQGTQVSAEQVRLGDVCYKLNGSTNTGALAWTQNLEKDAYPTFGTAGVHYARTMSNAWGTVVLPFDVTYDQSNGNYKLYKLSNASVSGNTGTLTFSEYDNGTIAPGTPMAVQKLTGDGIDIVPASNPNYKTTITPVSPVTGWTMKGTYSNLTDQKNIYFIASNQFWWAEEGITIAPFRAWFTGPAPTSNVKAFTIEIEDDDVTGIHVIVNGKLSNGKYLENGKVVIMRNGKKYNLNGQALR